MGLDDMQNMRDTQEEKEEGGTKGEDWEEVSVLTFLWYLNYKFIYFYMSHQPTWAQAILTNRLAAAIT